MMVTEDTISEDMRACSSLPHLVTCHGQHSGSSHDFSTLSLTNSSDGGFFASQYQNDSAIFDPGSMISVPSFGVDGILVLLGGSGCSSVPFGTNHCESGVGSFNNMTIYDLHTQSWL